MFIDDVLNRYPYLKKPDAMFNIQNVADYVMSCEKDYYYYDKDLISMRIPFKICTFQTKMPKYTMDMKTLFPWDLQGDVIVHAEETTLEKITESFFIESNAKGINKDIDKIFSWYKDYDKDTLVIILKYFFNYPLYGNDYHAITEMHVINNQGLLISPKEEAGYLIPRMLNRKVERKYPAFVEDVENGMGVIPFIINTLNFLHCKNVKISTNFYNSKFIKNREKKQKPYFEKYYTLQIEPMKNILNEEGKAQTMGLKHAFHICRGHFKTYDEKPLFGKYRGTYWVESHVRGDASIGKIKKDYEIVV